MPESIVVEKAAKRLSFGFTTSPKKPPTKLALRSLARLGSSFLSHPTTPPQSPGHSPTSNQETMTRKEKELLDSITQVRKALDLFFNSRILEAEAILKPHQDTSMYYSLGYGFILFLKSMMTFTQEDIEATLVALKKTTLLASHERKKEGGWLDNITTWVKSNSHLEYIKSMTLIQRHAELVYAEAHLLKALLNTIYDESIVSFLREGLNIRTSYTIYCNLEKYVTFVQQQADEGKDISHYKIEDHFTSGVALGVGCFNLVFSMLPPSVVKVAEFVGFSSDREHGMAVLESIGGWDVYKGKEVPAGLPELQGPEEGLRRQLCDMVILTYHIVLSKSLSLNAHPLILAEKVLNYNLALYPKGVFFLYFNGRLLVTQQKLEEAKVQYQLAVDTQKDWKQIQHICYWELGVIAMAQSDWEKAHTLFESLRIESNWSTAVYTYLQAISLYMKTYGNPEQDPETSSKIQDLMKKVGSSKKKVAGKSIPLEKFVSRKSRSFLSQQRLVLPDLEMLHVFLAFESMPPSLLQHHLSRIEKEINGLDVSSASYYDDLCLIYYLYAVLLRNLCKYPSESPQEELRRHTGHTQSLQVVFENASKIRMDHYIYYFAYYEKAQMLMMEKDYKKAMAELHIVLKANDRGQYGVGIGSYAKSKYSLANGLVFRCHNCLVMLQALASSPSSSH